MTSFRVWAPESRTVDLLIDGRYVPMAAQPCGYWFVERDDAPPGTRYRYRLDGDPGRTFPDPASRFQPEGVHGPSEVVDPSGFRWTAGEWTPPGMDALTLYELHIGTFTTEGSFRGAIARLPYLRDLGVTAIEIMPVAEFPGRWNWGYDGVDLFAPSRAYGRPDDLRLLVDSAHQQGLAVFLDVVYNHLGPDGAYAHAFSPFYFTDRHRSPWGRGVNLDGPHGAHVRRFFIENALHWVQEYRVDGIRLDATHAIVDESPRHFLEELATTVREEAGRPVLFIAEDERDLSRRLRPAAEGGWALDGAWADGFHHDLRVHVAHDRHGYFSRYRGTTTDLARRVSEAMRPLVFCIQNHDQVGNRSDGARLHHQVDPAVYRAATALLLLAPATPLLFMGQEWAASTPFLFFTDHHPELGQAVTEGRRREFSAFPGFADPEAFERIPDPQAPATFAASRLRWDELGSPPHAAVLGLYKQLLALRQALVPERATSRALDDETVAIEWGTICVIVRLGGSGVVQTDLTGDPSVIFTTEDATVVDDPHPPAIEAMPLRVTFARPGAIVVNLGRGLAPSAGFNDQS